MDPKVAMRSPLHGGVDRNGAMTALVSSIMRVAPSRGRGSKLQPPLAGDAADMGRPFTGAWIETNYVHVTMESRQLTPTAPSMAARVPAMA